MRKNRTISSVFILLVGLLMIATPSFLAAQEKSTPPRLGEAGPPEITQVMITTSGRADYQYFTLENPPRLVIHFASENVFNDYFQGQKEEFSEGILASMEAQYYLKPEGLPLGSPRGEATGKAEGQARTPLQGLILTLRSLTTYQVIEEENAIVVLLKEATLAAREDGIPTELAITRVVSGSKDLTAEQEALIDTFSLAKARQMAEAVQPVVQSQRPRSEMAYWWLLLLPLIGVIGFVLRALFMRGGRGKKENLSVAKMIANLGELQEKLTEQESQVRAEGETRRKAEQALEEIRSAIEQTKTELDTERAGKEKITQELETLRKGYAALEKEKQELTQRLELQHQQGAVSHREFEEKLSGAYAKIEQIQTELTTERAEKEKVFKEHREFPRIELKENGVLIRMQSSPEEFFNSHPLNLSTGGCCLKVPSDWVFRGDVELRLFFFGNPHPIQGSGRKIWEKETNKQMLVGIAFDSISGQDRDRIRQYVERKTEV